MELSFIKEMFDKIAPRYDTLNRLLSLKQDVYWRKNLVSSMKIPKKTGKALDIACGTGDVALEIFKQYGKKIRIFGADFSKEMLVYAKEKIENAGAIDTIHLMAGDAFYLPFDDETFNSITIAFGIRNIKDRITVLKGFYDLLKPGGELFVLELATPENSFLLSLYLLYFQKLLPLIGRLISGDKNAYKYLPASVVSFPPPEKFAETMQKASFSRIRWRRLTFGVATLFIGYKKNTD